MPSASGALAAQVLYCLDRLTAGYRILLPSVAGYCRNYENCRDYEISL